MIKICDRWNGGEQWEIAADVRSEGIEIQRGDKSPMPS
jgi:hypothetical protein